MEAEEYVKSLRPHNLGYLRATMIVTNWYKCEIISESKKSYLSSNYFLKLGNMKVESQVIVEQPITSELTTNLVHTARRTLVVNFLEMNIIQVFISLCYITSLKWKISKINIPTLNVFVKLKLMTVVKS